MKRKLLTQIANEWHTNLWIALELLIVSVVLWYITDNLYYNFAVRNAPLGFDYDHCYNIEFSRLSKKSPDYREYTSQQQMTEEKQTLIRRLESRPEIEAVGASINSAMYNYSNSGAYIKLDSFTTANRFVVQRMVTPEFVRVFKYRGANGESPEEIAKILEENPYAFFASDGILSGTGADNLQQYIGRTFENKGNGPSDIVLKGILQTVRYSDYHPEWSSHSTLHPMPTEQLCYANEITVRVKDNMDTDFEQNIMKDIATDLKIGNLYVTGVRSLADRRNEFNRYRSRSMYYMIAGASFLAFNVFLGLLGTFWFRTQQREHEIAIRRVNGATSSSIFQRTISEGLIILSIVTPIAIGIDYLITANELNTYHYPGFFVPARFFMCAAIVYLLMVMMIVAGALLPARKAVKIQPAAALAEN